MRYFKAIQILLLAGVCSLAVSSAYADYNWPYGPPPGSTSPSGSGDPKPGPQPNTPPKDPCKQNGSIIGCETQTLGEVIKVIGTPLSLHYQSDRVPGRRDAHMLKIRLSSATLPPGLQRIHLEVTIAGQAFKKDFAPQPNLVDTFTWDGKDAYGRPMQGRQPAKVRIGYEYKAKYYTTFASFAASFNRFGSPPDAGARGGGAVVFSFLPARTTTPPILLWQEYEASVGHLDSLGLGGWGLSIHHRYDVGGRTLYFGNGDQRSAAGVTMGISTVAGMGVAGFEVDGKPATQTMLIYPRDVAVGSDGSLYIGDTGNTTGIRRVGPDGIIVMVAGTNDASGNAGFALESGGGSVYIVGSLNHSIRRVGRGGFADVTPVAGTGVAGFSGDGGPATQAQLNQPRGVAVGSDGSLYIADTGSICIRRVGPDGIITTVAGKCLTKDYTGDGGLATQATLFSARAVAVGPDGSLYIVDSINNNIRRVSPDGIITTVAGTGTGYPGFGGDGGPAIQAQLNFPEGIAVGFDGSLYIADTYNHRIRRVGPDGIITTLAGTGISGFAGDGGPAAQAQLNRPLGVAVGPNGSLYIADSFNHRIRQIGSSLPGFSTGDIFIAAEDGSEVYVFNGIGRHLKTLDALTGAVRYQFTYDSVGRLTTLTDGDGNVTSLERDSSGNPTAIVAPFGQRTTLTVQGDGYLSRVTNPAGEAVQLTYNSSAEGLLATLTDPRGNVHKFTYDALGRLVKDEDPAGGAKTLARTDITDDHYAVSVTTALGRVTKYEVEELSTGAVRRSVTGANGTKTVTLINTDGSQQTTYADGSSTSVTYGPDPRFGMLAPVASRMIIKTPGGLTRTITTTRTAALADPADLLSLTKLTDTISDNGAISTRVYTNTGGMRTLATTTPAGRSNTVTLDALGRITQAQALGLAPVSYAYDTRGFLSAITEGSGATSRTTLLAYNAAHELIGLTDPLGRTLGLAYDSAGRLVTQTLPGARTVKFAYDGAGNTTAITPPGRQPHSFGYTAIDQTASYTPPDVGSGSTATQYSYNVDRALTRTTRPDGQLIDISYDTAGRTTSLAIARGLLSYSYDAITSRLSSITAPGGLGLSYSRDGDLLTGVTWSGAVAGRTAYTYNNDRRVTAESVNGANSVSYGYDVDGLLSSTGSLALTHDVQNGLRTGSALGSVTDSLTYNTLGELTNYSASYTATEIYSAVYSRDALGRTTQKVENAGGPAATYGYSYDTVGRLSAVTKDANPFSTYSYDSNSNRTARTGPGGAVSASYDAQDRLTSYGSTTYSYTTNGELLSKTTGAQTTSYQYDALGNLLKVALPGGGAIDYLIDGSNRRIGKKVNGTLVQGFLYQGSLRPVAELNGSNAVVSRFVYATHINVPDYMVKSGTTYRIIADQLGSPRLVVDVTTGAVVQRIDYDEFGKVLSDSNPSFQPFGFAGGLYDHDTKLVRFGARDYDAETGRWTAKDPIRFAARDTNIYSYVASDPINRTDPLGLQNVGPKAPGPVGPNIPSVPQCIDGYEVNPLCLMACMASSNPFSGPFKSVISNLFASECNCLNAGISHPVWGDCKPPPSNDYCDYEPFDSFGEPRIPCNPEPACKAPPNEPNYTPMEPNHSGE